MTSDSPDSRIQALVAWSVSNGARIHPSLEVHRSSSTGLSLRVRPQACRGPDPSEPLLRVPTRLTLSYRDALLPEASFPDALLRGAPPHVVGRLFLVCQFLKGGDSFWAPYVAALPQPGEEEAWALPPFWRGVEAELLEGTNVDVGADKIRTEVAAELELVRRLLDEDSSSHVASSLAKALDSSPTLYHWAYCIFSSRSFRPGLVLSAPDEVLAGRGASLDDYSVLFPLFDIANHAMTVSVEWRLDESRGFCDLVVDDVFSPGAQIFNNYGLKTNGELLLGYGFMLPVSDELHNDYAHVRKRATADEYLISLRPLAHASSLLVRSRRQQLGIEPADDVLGAFRHVQPDMVWDMFCALVPDDHQRHLLLPTSPDLTGDDAERQRRRSFLTGRVTAGCRPHLEQTVALIQHKVLQELERLDETDVDVIGGDLDLLTRNQRLALDYRARCRQVLENTLEAIRLDGDEEE